MAGIVLAMSQASVSRLDSVKNLMMARGTEEVRCKVSVERSLNKR
jgi:hypothetical protein